MPKTPAHRVALPRSGKPHLKGIMGIKLIQGAALTRPSLPARLAALPSGISPRTVPIRAASQPVAMASRTGKSKNILDFKANTCEYRINATRVIREMIQLVAIHGAPMPKSARPIMAMVGPMTMGLIILRT